MSESFDAAEVVNELALEEVNAGQPHKQPMWVRLVALSTLVMALFTAVGALLAGMTAHEALLDRTEEIIEVTISENDRLAVEVLRAKVDILAELGQPADAADLALIEAYEAESKVFHQNAAAEESRIQSIGVTHLLLAVAVATLSVGISVSGMAIIVNQRYLWVAGLVFGIAGSIGVLYGISTMVS